MNTSLQRRVLYRHFLFRLMDVELLSASAEGESSDLIGQLVSLLLFGDVLLAWGGLAFGSAARDTGLPGPLWGGERFMISLTMLVVGVFALISWDSTFPDRRDVMVLGHLPVRGRALIAAKIGAAATALGLVVAAWNCLAGFVWPMAMAPNDLRFLGTLRFVGAFWLTLFAAGVFLYSTVLIVQAAAALLPRSWYLHIPSVLQITLLILFLVVFFFPPSFPSPADKWLPPCWFLGLLSEWSGVFPAASHAVMEPLAREALEGLAVSVALAASSFLLSYFRTMRKIVEEPDILPGGHFSLPLPRLGSAPQTGLTYFVIRSLLRSRRHRTMLAFFLGGGSAITVVYLEGARDMTHLSWMDLVRHADAFLLVPGMVMLCAAWLGTRVIFSLPLDLRSNWLFRAIPLPGGAASLAAIRRALAAVCILPVLAVTAPILWSWPWIAVAEHLLLLTLFGSILVDLSLRGFRKIPFTCSYLPGKSKVHMVFWFGIVPAVMLMHQAAQAERQAMAYPSSYWLLAAVLAAGALAARISCNRNAAPPDEEPQFEESPSDKLVSLSLNG